MNGYFNRLAIDGGPQVRSRPFAPWPAFDVEEIDAACKVLQSGKVNYWTGQEGQLFEREFASQTRCKYAVAVANGTVALELALEALDIGPGDEVIVPSRSFVATASCVAMRNAIPVFADISEESQTITAQATEQVLTKKTKAIIAVHLAGWPCDMDGILTIAKKHSLVVIEDCAQAQGAQYRGCPVGSLGDAAAFSFCQDKIMSTGGEGGMLVTNREDVWRKAWSFKDHGKDLEACNKASVANTFQYVHHSIGTNWRMTEMQSAIGRRILSKVPEFVAARRHNAHQLDTYFKNLPELRSIIPSDEVHHSYYKYYAFIRPEQLRDGWTRDRVLLALRAEGIPCSSGSCSEIYLEAPFWSQLRPKQRHPVASRLGSTSIMFLVHPTLNEQDMADTYTAVKKVLGKTTTKGHRVTQVRHVA